MSTTQSYLTTRELAERRGVSRQAIVQAVWRGALKPAMQLAGGAYLFTEDQAQTEAAES